MTIWTYSQLTYPRRSIPGAILAGVKVSVENASFFRLLKFGVCLGPSVGHDDVPRETSDALHPSAPVENVFLAASIAAC